MSCSRALPTTASAKCNDKAESENVKSNSSISAGSNVAIPTSDANDMDFDSFDEMSGQGYTPLNEILCDQLDDQVGTGNPNFLYTQYAPMTMNHHDDSDSNDDDDDNSNSGGIFFSNPLAFHSPRNPSVDEEVTDKDGYCKDDNCGKECEADDGVKTKNQSELDFDYRALADQVLRSLDDEYRSAVVGVRPTSDNVCTDMPTDNINSKAGEQDMKLEYKPCSHEDRDGSLPLQSDADTNVNVNINVPQSNKSHDSTASHDITSNNTETETETEITANAPTFTSASFAQEANTVPTNATKQHPPIDKDAIAKALNNIRIRSPSLATTLDNWKVPPEHASLFRNQHTANHHPNHPLLPYSHLNAFNQSTPRDQTTTSNLTRSASIAEAFVRLYLPNTYHQTPTTKSNTQHTYTQLYQHTNLHLSNSSTFVIHVVGADHVECDSISTVRQKLRPFARWLDKYIRKGRTSNKNDDGVRDVSKKHTNATNAKTSKIENDCFHIKHVRIELIGPNVPTHATAFQNICLLNHTGDKEDAAEIFLNDTTTTTASTNEGLLSCIAVCKNCIYHDYLDQLQQKHNTSSSTIENHIDKLPNMAIAFNAGIWGYDLWKPTLQALCRSYRPIPFIITAYTTQEAEDDAEVVEEIVEAKYGTPTCHADHTHPSEDSKRNVALTILDEKCLWKVEVNPFSSKIERKTHTAPQGRKYYSNAAWQAWLLGGQQN